MTVEVEISPVAEKAGLCTDFDHVVFYVSSPKLVATYLQKVFGFSLYATKGLETGSRDVSATVVCNGNVKFILMGAIRPLHQRPDNPLVDDIHRHIASHGDSVKDVAFQSTKLEAFVENLKSKNALNLLVNPDSQSDSHITAINDEFGTFKYITVNGKNDTVHTIIDRSGYSAFMPGYKIWENPHYVDCNRSAIQLDAIDHCVQNQDWNEMINVCNFYKEIFNFHQFWSVDEKQVYTEYSALKSTVMASENDVIKMPVNEPAVGLKKSQIEEFVEFYGGSGAQHIAIRTHNIINTIKKMKENGAEFIEIPDSYYDNLEKKLKQHKHPKIKESLKLIKKYGILVDFDENGYLLQLFTKPVFERPTFFFEIIQRANHNGFGAGNFKGLFEVLEKDQERRGNLTTQNVQDYTKGLVDKPNKPNKPVKPQIKDEVTDDDIADAINYMNLE